MRFAQLDHPPVSYTGQMERPSWGSALVFVAPKTRRMHVHVSDERTRRPLKALGRVTYTHKLRRPREAMSLQMNTVLTQTYSESCAHSAMDGRFLSKTVLTQTQPESSAHNGVVDNPPQNHLTNSI